MTSHQAPQNSSDESWEQEIRAALQLLNEAEPPAGMHARLNALVHARPQHRLPGRSSSSMRRTRPSLFGVLASLACACLLIVFLQHTQHTQHRQHAHDALPAGVHLLISHAQSIDAARVSSPVAVPSPIPAPTQVFHLALTTQSAVPQAHRPEPSCAPGSSLPTQAELDAQALADTHAPSHPAPTLELTAQERQASLMMRRGERRNVASLDPAYQVLRAQQVQADFQSFLHPALTPFERQVERDAQRVQAGLPLSDTGLSPSDSQLVTGDRK